MRINCFIFIFLIFYLQKFNNPLTGCWENDPHKRPGFRDILTKLEDIARSGFTLTPQESFNTMQDAWKKEIAEVLQELRLKEKVCKRRCTYIKEIYKNL